MITYFEDGTRKSKKKYKNHKVISNLLRRVDTFVIIATTSTPKTLSVNGFVLIL